MERPQIYFFLLPLSIITLILYFKMLYVLWKRRENYNTLFYKLIWTQVETYRIFFLHSCIFSQCSTFPTSSYFSCSRFLRYPTAPIKISQLFRIGRQCMNMSSIWIILIGFNLCMHMHMYVLLDRLASHWAHTYHRFLQILGVTLNSIGRVLMVRFSTKTISTVIHWSFRHSDIFYRPWTSSLL